MKPGTIGLSVIPGHLGWWIRFGQGVTGDWSYWSHVFIVLDNDEILQAMPRGAEIVPLSRYLGRDDVVFLHAWPDVDEFRRKKLIRNARAQVGRKYGFLDYLYLALPRRLRGSLGRHIVKSRRVICSQLVDELYRDIGFHLFDDDREPHDVTPGDILIRYVRALSEWGIERL